MILNSDGRNASARRLIGKFYAAIWLALGGGLVCGCQGSGSGVIGKNERVLVIVVHGTWGGESEWPKAVPGKVTFGSEVLRGLKGQGEIYPFVWASSIFHDRREEAVQRLVRVIDEQGPRFDRVCLVGHSHGGNVALLAAGRCRQKIEAIVCLSTPHVYLCAIGDQGEELFLPAYCPPETTSNVGRIVSLWPDTDKLPGEISNALLRGLGENEALELTTAWREKCNHPRLPKDNFLTRALERFNEVIGIRLFESGNIVAAPKLVVPQAGRPHVANVEYLSLIADPIESHAAVHSRRMGYLVGQILRHGLSPGSTEYLRTVVQPEDSDCGEPVSEEVHQQWLTDHAQDFQHFGWQLQRVEVVLTPGATRVAADRDGSLPDPLLRISAEGIASGRTYAPFDGISGLDIEQATWEPRFFVYEGDAWHLSVVDLDVSTLLPRGWDQDEQVFGAIAGHASGAPADRFEADESQSRFFSARLVWLAGHY